MHYTEYIGAGSGTRMAIFRYLPAILAAVTDVGTAVFVRSHQPDYPFQFLFFQLAMFGLAFLMAAPAEYRVVRVSALSLLILGVFLASFTVGVFYVPTVIAAGWLVLRDRETAARSPTASR